MKLLKELIRVMKEVDEAGLPLNMRVYYEDKPSGYSIHTCGTAACIAGYGALDEEVIKLADINKSNAPGVYKELINEIGLPLAESILAGDRDSRYKGLEARINSRLNPYEYMHICINDPTPKDAIEYMEAVLKGLE